MSAAASSSGSIRPARAMRRMALGSDLMGQSSLNVSPLKLSSKTRKQSSASPWVVSASYSADDGEFDDQEYIEAHVVDAGTHCHFCRRFLGV